MSHCASSRFFTAAMARMVLRLECLDVGANVSWYSVRLHEASSHNATLLDLDEVLIALRLENNLVSDLAIGRDGLPRHKYESSVLHEILDLGEQRVLPLVAVRSPKRLLQH